MPNQAPTQGQAETLQTLVSVNESGSMSTDNFDQLAAINVIQGNTGETSSHLAAIFPFISGVKIAQLTILTNYLQTFGGGGGQ